MVWISVESPSGEISLRKRVFDEEAGLELISDAGTRGIKSCIICPYEIPEKIRAALRQNVQVFDEVPHEYAEYVLAKFSASSVWRHATEEELGQHPQFTERVLFLLRKSPHQKLPIPGSSLEKSKDLVRQALIADAVGSWREDWRPRVKVDVSFEF